MEIIPGIGGVSKARKNKDLFTDEDLTDILEHTSLSFNLGGIRNKSVAIKLEHTGTITDYFVVVKIQSSYDDIPANYRTIVEPEFEDDGIINFPIEDNRNYLRCLAQADEGSVSDYITINITVDGLGD